MEMEKNLSSLSETWEDNVEKMITAKKGSKEYAEALGAVKKTIKDSFGVEVSTEFLENKEN
jgi:hypothetical protein